MYTRAAANTMHTLDRDATRMGSTILNRRLITALILFLGLSSGVNAQIPPRGEQPAAGVDEAPLSESDRQRVRGLIDSLDADDPARREWASAELKGMGARLRAILEQSLVAASPETRLRLRAILLGLPGDEEVLPEPTATRVTIHVRDIELQRVVQMLEDQGGPKFQLQGLPPDLRVTLDLDQVPVFEAIDALCARIDLRWFANAGQAGIRLMRGNAGAPRVLYDGPFRFALLRASRSSTVTFGEEPQQSFYLQGQLDVEDQTSVIGLWSPPTIEVADDEEGRSLLEAQPFPARYAPTEQRPSFSFSIRLEPKEDSTPRQVSRLSGRVRYLIGRRYQRVSVSVPGGEAPSEVTGQSLTVRVAANTVQGPHRTVMLEVERPPLVAPEGTDVAVFDQVIEARGAAGEAIPLIGVPGRVERDGREVFTLRFAAEPPLESIDFSSLTAIEERELAFAFENLPLP